MNKRLWLIIVIVLCLARDIRAQDDALFILPDSADIPRTAQPFVVLPSGLVAVMNPWANSVGIVNLQERTLTAEVALTGRPTSMAYLAVRKALIVYVADSQRLTLIDALTFDVLEVIIPIDVPLSGRPADISIVGVRDDLIDLVIGFRLATLSVDSVETIFGNFLGTQDIVSMTRWGDFFYSVSRDGAIEFLIGGGQLALYIPTDSGYSVSLPMPITTALDARNQVLYVPLTVQVVSASDPVSFDEKAWSVIAVVDLATFSLRQVLRLDVADGVWHLPSSLTLNADRTQLFVTYAASNRLSVIDLRTQQRIASMETGAVPIAVGFSRDNQIAFTVNRVDGSLSLFETRLFAPLDTIRTTTLDRALDLQRGEQLFHSAADPQIAWNNSLSCNTCHSNGDTMLADQNDADLRVFLMQHIVNQQGGSGLNEIDMNALIAYLRALP